MSINWVELNPQKQPLPIGQERILPSSSGRLLEAKLKISSPISQTPRSEGNTANGTELNAAGTAYLSDMRHCVGMKPNWNITDTPEKLVFVSSNDKGAQANWFSTFSALFTNILSVNYVQPWFGGNYIEVTFKPTPDGGLPVGAIAIAQLRTDGRGLYEFISTMQHWMEVARRKQQEATTLPAYTPPRNNAAVHTQPVQPSSNAPHLLDAPNELPPAYTI